MTTRIERLILQLYKVPFDTPFYYAILKSLWDEEKK